MDKREKRSQGTGEGDECSGIATGACASFLTQRGLRNATPSLAALPLNGSLFTIPYPVIHPMFQISISDLPPYSIHTAEVHSTYFIHIYTKHLFSISVASTAYSVEQSQASNLSLDFHPLVIFRLDLYSINPWKWVDLQAGTIRFHWFLGKSLGLGITRIVTRSCLRVPYLSLHDAGGCFCL